MLSRRRKEKCFQGEHSHAHKQAPASSTSRPQQQQQQQHKTTGRTYNLSEAIKEKQKERHDVNLKNNTENMPSLFIYFLIVVN